MSDHGFFPPPLKKWHAVFLGLILVISVAVGFVVQAAAQGPGPPATIAYSTMLPQLYPAVSVAPSGDVFLAGSDVERIAARSRSVTRLASFPKRTAGKTRMPAVWARALAAGSRTVAATGQSGRKGPASIARDGAHVLPHGANTLVLWRSGGRARSLALGGSCNQSPRAIAVDAHGSIVVTGVTTSGNFLTVHPAQPELAGASRRAGCPRPHAGLQRGDVFLTRISARGRITYSTYLGGSDADEPRAVTTDAAGNMYVAGVTLSPDFPHVRASERSRYGSVKHNGWYCDGHSCYHDFVAKFDKTGRLVWVTMLPLGSYSGDVHGIAVHQGSVYLVGDTISSDLPTVHAAQPSYGGGSCEDYDGLGIRCRDAWVTKLTPQGTFAFTTNLGGSGDDVGQAVVIGPHGMVYVGGTTDSIGRHFPNFWLTDFPRIRTVSGAPGGSGRCSLPAPCGDAFVSEFTGNGKLVGSWALGGSDNDTLSALGLDRAGHLYLSGDTSSCDFPVRGGTRLHQSSFSCPATFVTEVRIGREPEAR